MNALGDTVHFTTSSRENHQGIVVEIFQRDAMPFARVLCRDDLLREIPMKEMRPELGNEERSAMTDNVQIKQETHENENIVGEKTNEALPWMKEMDVNAYEVVTLQRPLHPTPAHRDHQQLMSVVEPGMQTCLIHLPTIERVRRYQQDIHRLLISDPCPVLGRLAYSEIGDQLYIPPDWQQRAGSCDPHQKRSLPRPAKTIGYLLRLGLATLGEKVVYRGGRDKIMAEGWIANNGILCARCGYVVGCTEFEKCAGMRMRKPGKHIYFADGRSLLEHTLRMRANYL